jgi:enoyl-CoA hydratase/carnithine racemase
MRNRLERAEAGLPGTAVSAHDLPDIYLKFQQWGLPGVRKPVISAVNGLAAGIGFHLVMLSDLRIAAESASFSLPEVKASMMGGSHRLALQGIPLAIMQQLVLTGEPISAQRAYEVGLLNNVVPGEKLLSEAMALARHIAKQPPLAISYNKLATWKAVALADQMADHMVLQWTAELMKTEDHKEALNAFLEKREPRYTGR